MRRLATPDLRLKFIADRAACDAYIKKAGLDMHVAGDLRQLLGFNVQRASEGWQAPATVRVTQKGCGVFKSYLHFSTWKRYMSSTWKRYIHDYLQYHIYNYT